MRRCRIAVIGLGKIALDQHPPAISASERFGLAAVASQAALAAEAGRCGRVRMTTWHPQSNIVVDGARVGAAGRLVHQHRRAGVQRRQPPPPPPGGAGVAPRHPTPAGVP
ncbi:MAG: hypothetical protein J0I21_02450, partial [Alphaproteobacteria bacterium]|nr:hypothetical protein [Alphaproteobacteria bacterium]